MERPPVSGAPDESPESKPQEFTPCVVRQSTTSSIVTPSPIKGRAPKPSAKSSEGATDAEGSKTPTKAKRRMSLPSSASGKGFKEASARREALQESFIKTTSAEARLMKELGESKPVIQEKEVVMLEEELEMIPFVIKVQRAFRLVKFVYRKFGPLLFVDHQSQASYGHIKFRHVLKPASWIAVAPSVSARRLVKFMDYYWELPKPEVLVTITGGAQDFALAPDLHMAFDRGIVNVGQSAMAWFFTSGSDTGVMKHVGYAMRRNDLDRPLIGIFPFGATKGREMLASYKGKVAPNPNPNPNPNSNPNPNPNPPRGRGSRSARSTARCSRTRGSTLTGWGSRSRHASRRRHGHVLRSTLQPPAWRRSPRRTVRLPLLSPALARLLALSHPAADSPAHHPPT